jgi:dTMP kinase
MNAPTCAPGGVLITALPRPTAPGCFISLEGIDGAGKSSHLSALADLLRSQGHTLLLTREPGGTPLAEQLRALFLHSEMDALTEALLVFAARRDHLRRVIAPALARGEVVVCDRFTDATFAYQGAGRGFDLAVLAQLERWVQQMAPGADQGGKPAAGRGDAGDSRCPALLQPDLTLWFDLPATVAAARRAAARSADRLEREDQDFFERVSAGYAQRAASDPQRFARIDADQPITAVWAQVLQVLQSALAVQALPSLAPRTAPGTGPASAAS